MHFHCIVIMVVIFSLHTSYSFMRNGLAILRKPLSRKIYNNCLTSDFSFICNTAHDIESFGKDLSTVLDIGDVLLLQGKFRQY